MKKTKVINGLLCTVLLLQSLTGVGVTVFADEEAKSSSSMVEFSTSLSESVGLVESDTEETLEEKGVSTEPSQPEETILENSVEETVENTTESVQESKTEVSKEEKAIEEKTPTVNSLIVEGVYGSVPWSITKEGTLLLEGGTLADVKAGTNKKSPWVAYNADIKNVFIKESVLSTAYGAEALFSGLTQLKTITGIEKIDFGGAVSLRYLFSNTGLQSLNVNSMDVSQVTDISYIFSDLKVSELNVSNWDISKVNNVSSAFYGSTIGTLDLSNWNMENVTDLSSMFYRSTIQKLNVDKWNLGKVTSLKYIFFFANINEIIGMEKWYIPNLEDATGAFHSSNFKDLDLSNWRPISIIYMTEMFREAKVESIDLFGWDTKKLSSLNDDNIKIFEKTSDLQKISLDKYTSFAKVYDYNHQSENGHYDIWEGIETKRIYERTSSLLSSITRKADTFIRKQQTYHKVTYKDYYGFGSDLKDSIKDGTNISIPSAPLKYGYEFGGWYADRDFKQQFNFSEAVLKDTTVYVKWIPRKNRVTFNTDGGEKVPDQYILTGEQVIKPDDPKFENRYFRGWAYVVEAFGNKYYYDYDFSDPVTKDLELFARWGYILKFDTNGSDDWVSNQYFDYNSRIPTEPTQPWKKGHSFEGWYLDSQLTQRYNFYEEMDFEKNQILYAKYTKNETQIDLYGSIAPGNYLIYGDDNFWSNYSIDIREQSEIFHLTEKTFDRNGQEYYAISNKTEFLGYIPTHYVTIAKGAHGSHHSYGKYVNIKGNYDIWKGFEWKNKVPGSKYKNQTLHARGYYNHFNGSRYLSVYDNKGKWVGYINEKGTTLAQGQQGVYQKYGKYVTVKGNYKIWGNFAWSKSIPGSKYKNKTLQVKGVYNHFNGSRYLSLYDSKGKWVGYINENGTQLAKNKGGIALSAKFNRKVVKRNYTLWNDLNFKKKKGNSNQYLNQTLYVKVQYNHFNGSKYYSLYNAKNKWLGYINANGTK